MPVALNDLRRGRRRLEPESLAGDPLDLGVDRRVAADGAGELADAHAFESARDARPCAVELERPARELQPERRRLRVHTVRATDAERELVLLGARGDGCERAVEPGLQQRARLLDLQRERRVDHVRRREAVVEPAPVLAEPLRHGVDERRGVVVELRLELRDALGRRNRCAGADLAGRVLRNGADFGPAVERRELDLQPPRELSLVRPDARHGRSRVAGDHGDSRIGLRVVRRRGSAPRAPRRSARCRLRPRPPARPAASARLRAARRAPSSTRRATAAARRSPAGPCARPTTPGSAAESPAPQISTFSPRPRAERRTRPRRPAPVRRADVELVRDAALVELVERALHPLAVGLGADEDPDEGLRQRLQPRARRRCGSACRRRRSSAQPRTRGRAPPRPSLRRRHAEDPAAVRHEPAFVKRGPRVEDVRAGRFGLLDAGDRRAERRPRRDSRGREHDRHRGVVRAASVDVPSVPGGARRERVEQVPSSERHERLRLRIAEAAVELEHAAGRPR